MLYESAVKWCYPLPPWLVLVAVGVLFNLILMVWVLWFPTKKTDERLVSGI